MKIRPSCYASTMRTIRPHGAAPGEAAAVQPDTRRRAVRRSRRRGRGLLLNVEFLCFAHHWGFDPRSCRPYRARTKGKVECPIRYIRESFFYGRSFANDDDLNAQAADWLEGTANARRHGTTGERPIDRFERDERTALLPLANCPLPAPRRSPDSGAEAAASAGKCGIRTPTAQRLCAGAAMKAPALNRRNRGRVPSRGVRAWRRSR